MNEYSWNLDQDYISHGTAHYSKNWNQQRQDEYNKWYYQTHKEKFAERDKYRQQGKNYSDYADKLQKDSELSKQTAKRYGKASRHYTLEGDKANFKQSFKPDDKKLNNERAAGYNNANKAKATQKQYENQTHKQQVRSDAARKMSNNRLQKAWQIDQDIEKDKKSFYNHSQYAAYKFAKMSKKTINHGKYVIKNWLKKRVKK